MGDPARPGPHFLARSAGDGEGGWFPAPQPLIVGLGAPSLGHAVFRILGVRTKCYRSNFLDVERLRLVLGRLCSLWPTSPERGTRHPDAKRA